MKKYVINVVCNGKMFGRQESYMKKNGEIITFESKEECQKEIEKLKQAEKENTCMVNRTTRIFSLEELEW